MSTIQPDKIPAELRALRQWVVWKYRPDPDKPKPDKPPFYVNGRPRAGTQGSPEDEAALGHFQQAVATYEGGGYEGVGLAMLAKAGIVGLDFDDCVDGDGIITPWVKEIIEAHDTYWEISPSGRGIRGFFRGSMPDARNNERGLEVFHGKHYLTITGNCLNGTDSIAPLPEPLRVRLDAALRLRGKAEAGATRKRRWKNLTIEQVADALKHVDPEDRDRWLKVGIILGRYFKRSPAAWDLYESWSARSPKYDEDRAGNLMRMREMFHEKSAEKPPRGGDEIGLGSLIEWAEGWEIPQDGDAAYDNFYFIRPANRFLYVPSGALWPSESVNSALKARLIGYNDKGQPMFEKPSAWLSENRGINSMIFDPERDQITPDAVYRDQEVIEKPGATMFNTYHPSTLKLGAPSAAAPWVEHVHKLLPKTVEADHLIAWCAQRVQKPGEKVRHAILIGGPPGIGKDTIFEGIVPAIGAWNCASIAPDDLFSAFNEFKATIFLRVNEVVDLHEMSRFKLHEATKNLISGTPDYMTVNPKYGTKYATRNVCGIVMTTNHPTTGIYLPADDRRHFCVETIQLWGTEDERAAYFQTLWDWLLRGDGFAHVAAFLHSIDLNSFDPNRPPPKTDTFWQIVAHGMTGDEWLTEALDKLDNPPMVRLDELREKCVSEDLDARQFSIRIGPALSRAGYELFKNPTRQDGRHDLLDHNEKRACVAVYVRRGTSNATLAGLLAGIRTAKF